MTGANKMGVYDDDYLLEEIKILQRLLNERDKIIDDLEKEVSVLKLTCDNYDNLMRECIFDK